MDPNNNDARSPRPNHLSHRGQSSGWATSAAALTPDELDQMMANFTEEDDVSRKTMSRLLVEKLQKFNWYNPQKDDPDAPSLSKAWAYYEHITLARHFVGEQSTEYALRRAEPGDLGDTELYSVWKTPESSLNDWGIGVGVYFSTLRSVAFLFLLVGLINIPNIIYYNSDDYNGDASKDHLMATLRGSAICTNREWVVCRDCDESDWSDSDETKALFGKGVGSTKQLINVVQKTLCEGAELGQGMVNWASLLFLIFSMMILAWYQRKVEIRFDEDKTTSTDYSVKVSNPPPDALDPEVWRDFFEQFSQKQVTVVTIALNNDRLLRALLNRRIFRDKLRRRLPSDIDLDDEDAVNSAVKEAAEKRASEKRSCLGFAFDVTLKPILKLFNFFLPAEILVEKIATFTEEIKELQQEKYEASTVFVTFETEEGQRSALGALSAGKVDAFRNNTSAVAPSTIFQGRVLRVDEPTEPNAVRWLDLNVTTARKLLQRALTFSLTFGMICLSALAISRARRRVGPSLFSIVLAIFNFIVPNIVKLIMIFEKHSTEGGRQASLYLKITVFRWINTAILTQIITPFTSTIGDGSRELLASVNAILLAEMLLSPLLRVMDIMGTLRKHYFAPRAKTQEEMNRCFQGTPYNLAERFTDFTKVVFLCFFYSALFPSVFFIAMLTLFIQYYADKYCLMRIWAPAPFIGSQIAVFSRRYFFFGSLVALAIVSSYVYAQFPYDNVCDLGNETNVTAVYNVTFENGTYVTSLEITESNEVKYCDQNFAWDSEFNFPAVPTFIPKHDDWMTDGQEKLTKIYGWTSLIVLIVYGVSVFGGLIINGAMSLFRGVYKPMGRDQKIDFSAVPEIFGYVPQVKLPGFPFPFLACDIDDIDQNIIGWNDPRRSYDDYNLIFDIPYPGMKRTRKILENTRGSVTVSGHDAYVKESPSAVMQDEAGNTEVVETPVEATRPIFSIIKQWRPDWAKETAQKEQKERIVGV